jgi:hypothetical protein
MLWFLAPAALACAGLVHAPGATAEADASLALFEPGDGAVAVTYSVAYQGDAASFGWIVPVFGALVSVEDAEVETFEQLGWDTSPSVTYTRDGGCLFLASKGDLSDNGVDVVATGFTGTYDWAALTADDVASVEEWATENGWSIAASEVALASYVGTGSPLVLFRVSAEATSDLHRGLPPVKLTYEGDQVQFPSQMALGSEATAIATTVWVRGQGRAEVAGWTGVDGGERRADRGDSPEDAWLRIREQVGAGRGFVRTWAGTYDGAFVTRFDTVAPIALHDVDATFTVTDNTDEIRTEIAIPGREPEGDSAAWLLWVPALGWARRRARRDAAGSPR